MKLEIKKRDDINGYEANITSHFQADCFTAFGKSAVVAEMNVIALGNSIIKKRNATNGYSILLDEVRMI